MSNPKAHHVMASENPTLGIFATLPPEIRRLIWEDFHPRGHDTSSSSRVRNKTDLSILRTSRKIYEEVSTVIFSNDWLEFEISPLHGRDSWVDVYTWPRDKACWKFERC